MDSARLAANLDALAQVDADLAARVKAFGLPAERILQTASGAVTLSATTESGREALLHSRNDPVGEARSQVARATTEGISGLLVYGLGAGYHVQELLSRLPLVCRVAVFEKSIESLCIALALHDWAEMIRTGRLMLLVDLSKPAIIQRLGQYTLNFFAKTEVFAHPASWAAFPAYYGGVRKVVEEFFAYARMNLHTLAELSKITMMNVCLNLSSYVFAPGVKDLAGAAAGRPAILVAGGPSLTRNIDLLGEAAKGAVVISVPTVFRTLLDRGVVPDFVTCLDYHKISAKYFEGFETPPPVTLICDPKVSYAVVDTYPGPKRFFNHPFLAAVLKDADFDKGTIRWGATVAHLSLYLAEFLGADPIILVGQDLCYPYGITHMPGTAIHENWVPEFNRFSTFEMKEWETLLRVRPILRRAVDLDGSPVYTDEQMFTYLVHFEEDFLKMRAKVIDATEGGLPKQGTTRMTLADAIRTYCQTPFPREKIAPPAPPEGGVDEIRSRTLSALQRQMRDFEEVGRYYAEVLSILGEIHEKLSRGEDASSLIRKVREEAKKIDAFKETHKLVAGLAQPDEFRRIKADLEMATVPAAGLERQKRELARDRAYLGGLANACEILKAYLKLPLERLEGRSGGPPEALLASGGETASACPS